MPANNTLSMPPNSIPRPYWLSSTQTGLLDLLPQHRKIIYDDLFKDHEIYAVEEDYDDRPIEPPILSVCRQIRNEARVLFYKTALIGIYEDSGPTFTSNIYNYSEKVQLSCYNDQMPDFWPLNQMRNLRHIHLIAYLGDNLGRQPHAEEGQQLLEAIKIDMKDEISLMQALKRRCPQAKVDIESNFWPMRLHSTRRGYVIDSKLEEVHTTFKVKTVRKEFDCDRTCGICSTRSVMWFLVRVYLAALLRRKRNAQG